MPKAARAHTTNPASASRRDLPQTLSADPAVSIAGEIQRLWDAYDGLDVAEIEASQKGETSRETIMGERRDQITEWRCALELIGTYTVASSLPGAMIQMAWALNDVQTLAGDIEAIERRGKVKHDVSAYLDRIERLVKSAADVVLTTLGKDYEPVRKIVETYAHLGERDPNWLNMIDDLVSRAELERAAELKAARSDREARI